jgi:ubiquinone/menaquinone biosynthesis C-methylase UbiE
MKNGKQSSTANHKRQQVVDYYEGLGSRLGYRFVMKKSQHFGIYDDSHRTEPQAQENFSAQFCDLLPIKKHGKVLDAGCGQGVLAIDVAKRWPDVHVMGATIVSREVSKSQKLARENGVAQTTHFAVADYHKLPFENNSFDCVYAVETLSHAYDLETAISELFRVLKPGGIFVAAEYEFDFQGRHPEMMAAIADYVEHHASIHAVRKFSKGNFLKILKKAGFTAIAEHDWSDRLAPSFSRLRRIGRPYKRLVQLVGRENYHPNIVASSFYADGYEAGAFRYKIYVAKKGK